MWRDAGNRGIQGNLYEERPGLSQPDTIVSSQLPPNWALLSPAAKVVAPLVKLAYKKGKNRCAATVKETNEKTMREIALGAPR